MAAPPAPPGPPGAPGYPIREKRPLGVTILAILAILAGIGGLIGGGGSMALPSIISATGKSMSLPFPMVYFYAIGAVLLILGLISFFVAYGFWTGKRWAWMIGIILAILNIIFGAVNIAIGSYSAIVSIIFYLIIIFYLTRPHIKAWFGRGPATPTV
jgi:drug/metabolite transporter (DMT)-like permease